MLFKCPTCSEIPSFKVVHDRARSIFSTSTCAWIFLLQKVIFKSWNFNEVQGHFEFWTQESTCLAKLAVKWYAMWLRQNCSCSAACFSKVSRPKSRLWNSNPLVLKSWRNQENCEVWWLRTEPRCCKDIKGIVASKIDPKSFGTPWPESLAAWLAPTNLNDHSTL